jgi:caffeoyl-CoA O-methyltransferase
MSARSLGLSDQLWRYLVEVTVREPAVLEKLRLETQAMPNGGMQISPEQGRFMAFLVELIGVRRYLEVGVFTGYSSLTVALAMPPEGRVVACDRSDDWTRIARRYWEEAGVADKVELRLGPALDTLDALIENGEGGFDMAFFDADKEGSLEYYERGLKLVRQGGIVAFDNTLWAGRVAYPADGSEGTRAIRALNTRASGDLRVTATLVPIGDGLLLARKR